MTDIPEAEVQAPEVALSMNTIVNSFAIIENAINKGAFNAQELLQVLPVYQQLQFYLESQKPKPKQESK